MAVGQEKAQIGKPRSAYIRRLRERASLGALRVLTFEPGRHGDGIYLSLSLSLLDGDGRRTRRAISASPASDQSPRVTRAGCAAATRAFSGVRLRVNLESTLAPSLSLSLPLHHLSRSPHIYHPGLCAL